MRAREIRYDIARKLIYSRPGSITRICLIYETRCLKHATEGSSSYHNDFSFARAETGIPGVHINLSDLVASLLIPGVIFLNKFLVSECRNEIIMLEKFISNPKKFVSL